MHNKEAKYTKVKITTLARENRQHHDSKNEIRLANSLKNKTQRISTNLNKTSSNILY